MTGEIKTGVPFHEAIGLDSGDCRRLSVPVLAADATGEWLVADQTARIAIAPCGDALCGTVAWTKTPGGLDENNPDPAKRGRPILGLEILQAMKPKGPNRWEGNVYNALNGKIYKAVLTLEGADALKMEGCVLGGLLCGGQTWTRAKDVIETRKKGPETTGSVQKKAGQTQ